MLAAVAAILAANSSLSGALEAIWGTPVGIRIGDAVWEYPLRHWINDGLVTLFFFVVGLEIKREFVVGELSVPGAAALPVAAAIGGMIVPAGIFLALTHGQNGSSGWGVVMATDIAFVAGCLALLGNRIPQSLRAFILALAIIDDIGAILVIAVGYGHGLHLLPFAAALVGLAIVALLQWLGVRAMLAYWSVGLLTWAAMHESGIHPTITGVALGVLTPTSAWVNRGRLGRFLDWARHARSQTPDGLAAEPASVRQTLARATKESIAPQQRLEDALHPWSAFVILPLFALANAGVAISIENSLDLLSVAIVLGLAIGKPLGICTFAWAAVAVRAARKPPDVTWTMLLGSGMLAGIGFTMALFIGNLAFESEALQSAKLGILAASIIAGAAGVLVLFLVCPSSDRKGA